MTAATVTPGANKVPIADSTGKIDPLWVNPIAANTSFNPAGAIVATNVQAALVELDADLTSHIVDTVAAHDASAISFVSTGTLTATDANTAINQAAAASAPRTIVYAAGVALW